MILRFFYEVFYRPLFNALVFLYEHIPFADLGIAIIGLTILIRVVLWPLFQKSVRNQAVMQKLQPEVRRIQEQYKKNREQQVKELMQLYRSHNVNPFSGFLLLLVQLPILISLYHVFLSGLTPESFAALYAVVPQPDAIDFSFLGLINLTNRSIVIVALASVAQFIQGWLALRHMANRRAAEQTSVERLSRQMVYIAPGITLLVLWGLPAAVGLYWLTGSIFSIAQQAVVNRHLATAYGDGNSDNNQKNS